MASMLYSDDDVAEIVVLFPVAKTNYRQTHLKLLATKMSLIT